MRNFLETAGRWYQKACGSNDSFDQFVSMWISFNVIYGTQEERYEIHKMNNIVDALDRSAQRRILELPEVEFFCTLRPAINYYSMDQETRNTIMRTTEQDQERVAEERQRRPDRALKSLLSILNRVRNNLFHGSKLVHHPRDQEIVRNAYPIVRALVQAYLEQMRYPVSEAAAAAEAGPAEPSSSRAVEEQLSRLLDIQMQINRELQGALHAVREQHALGNPIGVLLDFDYLGQALFGGGVRRVSEWVAESRNRALQLYKERKPQAQRDLEEVLQWVDRRVGEVLSRLAPGEELSEAARKQLYEEYDRLRRKMSEKGYGIH